MRKYCKTCSSELQKYRYESVARFEKKQFCSAKCSRVFMKANNMGWWRPDAMKQRQFSGGGESL